MTFIHAYLPKEHQSVVQMSHELPEDNAPKEHEQEISEWMELALELGALGFWREDR